MSSRHATFLRYYAMPFSYKIIYAIISYVLLENQFLSIKTWKCRANCLSLPMITYC